MLWFPNFWDPATAKNAVKCVTRMKFTQKYRCITRTQKFSLTANFPLLFQMQISKNRTLLPRLSRCHLLSNQRLIKWNSWFACYLPILRVVPRLSAASQVCCLRILKTYVRSCMSQEHLNHCAVLHVHQHKLDALDIDEIVN